MTGGPGSRSVSAETSDPNLDSGPPLFDHRSPAILGVQGPFGQPVTGQLLEWRLDIAGDYQNPFDPEQIRLEAHILTPEGWNLVVPGFVMLDYRRRQDEKGQEYLDRSRAGDGWYVRWRALQPGTYQVRFVLINQDQRVETSVQPLEIEPASAVDFSRGFVRRSPSNPYAFALDSGRGFVPIGLNVCWAIGGGTFLFDRWWNTLADQGGNFVRIWATPGWNPLGLERLADASHPEAGLGRIDQQAAWRIDYLVNLAERRGLRILFCIESFNTLRREPAHHFWDSNPYNAQHGGPIQEPWEFFTNPQAQQLFRNRLRYIVARWGHSPAIFAWEFWNEVDLVSGYRQHRFAIADWHARMAEYLKSIDPYQHLVTTSFANPQGDELIDALPQLDFIQTHIYGLEDVSPVFAAVGKYKSRFGKPHIIGEYGTAAAARNFAQEDPQGIHVHQGLWTTLFSPTPATAMIWWWDNYIDPAGLYHLWRGPAHFAAALDPVRARPMDPSRLSACFVQPPPDPSPLSLRLEGLWRSWSPGPANRPTELHVLENGSIQNIEQLSAILHGQANQPALYNPLTIHVRYVSDGQFAVHVGQVSGYGASLRIYVDDQLLLEKQFPAGESTSSAERRPQRRYAGTYSVAVPAGPRVIRVENPGPDWLAASYELIHFQPRHQPWYQILALEVPDARAGEPAVFLWLRNRDWSLAHVRQGRSVEPVPPSLLRITDLPPGRYRLRFFDTVTGQSTDAEFLEVRNGSMEVPLPTIEKDLAVQIICQ